jgi:deoxyribodipyrimidine photo-lyase
VILTL